MEFLFKFLKINNLQYNLISKISDAKEGVINILTDQSIWLYSQD